MSYESTTQSICWALKTRCTNYYKLIYIPPYTPKPTKNIKKSQLYSHPFLQGTAQMESATPGVSSSAPASCPPHPPPPLHRSSQLPRAHTRSRWCRCRRGNALLTEGLGKSMAKTIQLRTHGLSGYVSSFKSFLSWSFPVL